MFIAAVDVGSPPKMGWASNRGHLGCADPTALVHAIENEFSNGRPVALGFEAPLWIPRGREFVRMTSNRGGIEQTMRRPWSAGAGCGSLAAGVANMAWIFEALYTLSGAVRATTLPTRLEDGSAQLLIWEAFVSGSLKSLNHEGDAELAVAAFANAWPCLNTAIAQEPAVNLVAASLLATGHIIGPDECGLAGVVVAAMPVG